MLNKTLILKFILRAAGVGMLLAIVGVVLPAAWMDACHQWLGLGPLPEGVVVLYLARALSVFYMMLGALCWIVASDPARYRRLILCIAVFLFIGGLAVGATVLPTPRNGFWWSAVIDIATAWLFAALLVWLTPRDGDGEGDSDGCDG